MGTVGSHDLSCRSALARGVHPRIAWALALEPCQEGPAGKDRQVPCVAAEAQNEKRVANTKVADRHFAFCFRARDMDLPDPTSVMGSRAAGKPGSRRALLFGEVCAKLAVFCFLAFGGVNALRHSGPGESPCVAVIQVERGQARPEIGSMHDQTCGR